MATPGSCGRMRVQLGIGLRRGSRVPNARHADCSLQMQMDRQGQRKAPMKAGSTKTFGTTLGMAAITALAVAACVGEVDKDQGPSLFVRGTEGAGGAGAGAGSGSAPGASGGG